MSRTQLQNSLSIVIRSKGERVDWSGRYMAIRRGSSWRNESHLGGERGGTMDWMGDVGVGR